MMTADTLHDNGHIERAELLMNVSHRPGHGHTRRR